MCVCVCVCVCVSKCESECVHACTLMCTYIVIYLLSFITVQVPTSRRPTTFFGRSNSATLEEDLGKRPDTIRKGVTMATGST